MKTTLAALLVAASATAANACLQYPATYTPRTWTGQAEMFAYLQARLTERPFATLTIGDSIMRAWPYELVEAMFGGPVLNTGVRGATLNDINARLQAWPYAAQSPAVVFVNVGTNDLAQGYCAGAVERGIVDMLGRLRSMYPNARIVWQTILGRGRYRGEFWPDVMRINAYVVSKAAGQYEVLDATTPLMTACRGQRECEHYADLVHPYYGGYEVIYREGRVLP